MQNNETSKMRTRYRRQSSLEWFALLALALSITSCRERNDYVPPPPPQVTVSRPIQKAVTRYMEFTGMTQAFQSVDVRARVEGYLQSISFAPGALVNEGDLLFVIDPKPYQAKLDEAKAALANAQAQRDVANAQYVRKQSALKSQAVSEFDVIQAKAQADAAAAAIDGAKAQVETAELNLGYTQVTSPLKGKVSRNLVDAGNLVGAGEATLLTNVVANSPMYVYFNIGERDLLELRGHDKERHGPNGTKILVAVATDRGFPHEGEVDFADNRLDPSTGTLQLRGVCPNQDYGLVGGLFVRVRVPVGIDSDSLLIPEHAVMSDQQGKYLLAVREEQGKQLAKQLRVTVGSSMDGLAVITSGLKADDRVIVNGMQRARQDAPVTAQEQREEAAAATTTTTHS